MLFPLCSVYITLLEFCLISILGSFSLLKTRVLLLLRWVLHPFVTVIFKSITILQFMYIIYLSFSLLIQILLSLSQKLQMKSFRTAPLMSGVLSTRSVFIAKTEILSFLFIFSSIFLNLYFCSLLNIRESCLRKDTIEFLVYLSLDYLLK